MKYRRLEPNQQLILKYFVLFTISKALSKATQIQTIIYFYREVQAWKVIAQ